MCRKEVGMLDIRTESKICQIAGRKFTWIDIYFTFGPAVKHTKLNYATREGTFGLLPCCVKYYCLDLLRVRKGGQFFCMKNYMCTCYDWFNLSHTASIFTVLMLKLLLHLSKVLEIDFGNLLLHLFWTCFFLYKTSLVRACCLLFLSWLITDDSRL